MAAIAYTSDDPWGALRRPRRQPSRRPAWDHVPEESEHLRHAAAPPLGARVYRRRRAVALMALVAVAMAAAAGTRLALDGSGGGTLTSTGFAGSTASISRPVPGRPYLVQSGDSLWSIVVASGRGGDPRPAVDRMALQLDGRPLRPGQVIQVP